MRLEVLAKSFHAGLGGVACDACQGVLALVQRLLVQLQGAPLDETLAAGVTAEGTLTSVHPLVVLQGVALVEALPTNLTPKWLLPRMYADMALQVAR